MPILTVSTANCALRTRSGTTAASVARACEPDGADGSGGCDPCDEACETNKRSLDENVAIRTIYGNTTVPWQQGETIRWHVLERRQNRQLVFNCGSNGIPDVCQNMCYGIACKSLPSTLEKSSSKTKCRAARKLNKCGATNPNRCSIRYPGNTVAGMSCDEYPFASTEEAQKLRRSVTRCVPAGENRSQGGSISALYKKILDGTKFEVMFDFIGNGALQSHGGHGGTGYCVANPNCALSGTQLDS
ncbi:deoxyribonuclease NucA/NucB-domain-containing protein [Fomitopsis betulina]|nr:deoxyribonuclease NucA/NucB-domain-containing protein [Fomitopsis betulina]